MKRLWMFLWIASYAVMAQDRDLKNTYAQALQAQQQGDYARFYDLIKKAYALNPYHQGIAYQAGIACVLHNKPAEAVPYLKQAILSQADFNLDVPELKALKSTPQFAALKKLQQELVKPVIHSDTALVITDRSLHPEGIAVLKDVFYIGSIHKRKIMKFRADGSSEEFTRGAVDGMTAVFALTVDEKRNVLWASSSPMPEMTDYNALIPSAVFKFDLRSGKLIKKFLPENPSMELVLGDLAINKKGDVWASDTKNNLLFKVNETSGKLEQVFSSDELINLQGITFSDDGKFLFLADYVKGVFRLEVAKLTLTPLVLRVDVSLKSIDGLIFHENSLLATQNNIKPMRMTRYMLNAELDHITAFEIIDRGHPAFNEPTQACVEGTTLYYIANSPWTGYNDQHQIKSEKELQDVVILKYELK